MTDDAERTTQEAEAARIKADLETRVWAILNDQQANYALAPHIVASGLGEVLLKVLLMMAVSKPDDIGFGLRLIHSIESTFVTQTMPDVVPVRH